MALTAKTGMTLAMGWVGACASMRCVLLGLWAGSVASFSFLVAPTLFTVIRSAPADRASRAPNALAGDVVVPVLQQLSWLSLMCGLLVWVLLLADLQGRFLRARSMAVALGLVSAVVSTSWLVPTMLSMLAQMGEPIDHLVTTHPLRVAFGRLHGLSAAIHLGMLLGPLTALWLERFTPHGSWETPGSQ
jgi:hypothetical protein